MEPEIRLYEMHFRRVGLFVNHFGLNEKCQKHLSASVWRSVLLAAHWFCSLPQVSKEPENNIRRMATQWRVQQSSTDTTHQRKSNHWFTANVKIIHFKIRKWFQTKRIEPLFMRMAGYRIQESTIINHLPRYVMHQRV